jgi:hypothetical protein
MKMQAGLGFASKEKTNLFNKSRVYPKLCPMTEASDQRRLGGKNKTNHCGGVLVRKLSAIFCVAMS